jgi:hypothetical protein
MDNNRCPHPGSVTEAVTGSRQRRELVNVEDRAEAALEELVAAGSARRMVEKRGRYCTVAKAVQAIRALTREAKGIADPFTVGLDQTRSFTDSSSPDHRPRAPTLMAPPRSSIRAPPTHQWPPYPDAKGGLTALCAVKRSVVADRSSALGRLTAHGAVNPPLARLTEREWSLHGSGADPPTTPTHPGPLLRPYARP